MSGTGEAAAEVTGRGASGESVRVGIAYPLADEGLAALRALSPRVELRTNPGYTQEAIDAVAEGDLDVLFAQRLPSDPTLAPSLRWLQVLSAGVDHVLAGGDWPARITLTNARGAYGGSIGQFAMSAILRTVEPLAARAAVQAAGRWPDSFEGLTSSRLRGRTAVLVGYGGIGREIGRLADAFGMRVIAAKARPDVVADDVFHLPGTGDPEGRIPERFVGIDELADAARDADYLIISLPLTPDSRRVVSAEVVEALPSRAWVVNVGRGGVIDEDALVAALQGGRIAGAALDVFEEEPLPDGSPLWTLPNVVITPHVAGWGAEPEITALLEENLRRYLAGEPLLNRIDVARGY